MPMASHLTLDEVIQGKALVGQWSCCLSTRAKRKLLREQARVQVLGQELLQVIYLLSDSISIYSFLIESSLICAVQKL